MSLRPSAVMNQACRITFGLTCGFASCHSCLGCRTPAEPSNPLTPTLPSGAHSWIRYMRAPPRLDHRITQHWASNVCSDSTQSESDGEHPTLVPGVGGVEGLEGIVVNVQPWEEEHGQSLGQKDCLSTEVTSRWNRILEDRMMMLQKP